MVGAFSLQLFYFLSFFVYCLFESFLKHQKKFKHKMLPTRSSNAHNCNQQNAVMLHACVVKRNQASSSNKTLVQFHRAIALRFLKIIHLVNDPASRGNSNVRIRCLGKTSSSENDEQQDFEFEDHVVIFHHMILQPNVEYCVNNMAMVRNYAAHATRIVGETNFIIIPLFFYLVC